MFITESPPVSNSSVNLISAQNVFALGLFNAFAQANPGQNLLFSPISIFATLSMILPGAQKQTLQQLLSAMRLTPDGLGQQLPSAAALRELESALGRLLASAVPGVEGDGDGAQQASLRSANRAFIQSGLDVRPEFLTALRDRIKSDVLSADFSSSSEAERIRINKWVSSVTKGKIPDLLKPGSIDSLTQLVLVNALYFKADWTLPFNSAATSPAPFEPSASSTPVSVKMMRMTKYLQVVYWPNELIGVRFGFNVSSGQTMSMLAVLPEKRHGLDALLAGMSERDWLRLLNDSGNLMQAAVSFPKAKLVGDFELSEDAYLPKLGVKDMFSAGIADLSGMALSPGDLCVMQFVHKAVLEWNEQGAEGAAASGTAISWSSTPIPIVFDHPFAVIVTREVKDESGRPSQVPIFVGRVSDPREKF